MSFEFRPLNSTDVFPMFKILGKIGINEFTSCLQNEDVKKLLSGESGENASIFGVSVMLEIANVVVTNIPKCEAEIYQLLASVSGMTVKQIKELGFASFMEMVIEFVKKEEFRDFIKVVSKLFKSEN